jgi:hypothetical protein
MTRNSTTQALDHYGLRFRPVDQRTAPAFIGGGTRNDAPPDHHVGAPRHAAIEAGLNVDDGIIAIDDVSM